VCVHRDLQLVVRSLVLRDHLCSGNIFENSDERPPNTVHTKYLSPYLGGMECLIRSFDKISIFILNNDCTIDMSSGVSNLGDAATKSVRDMNCISHVRWKLTVI